MAGDLLRLSQFNQVSANGISTLSLNELRGNSIHALILELGGTTFTKAHISEIKISIGSKQVVYGLSGSQLQKMNDYEWLAGEANFLAFYFGDPRALNIYGQHLGDFDFGYAPYQAQNATLEVTIGAATAPTLKAYAIVGPPKMSMGIGYTEKEAAMLRAMVRTVITPNAAVSKQAFQIGLGSQAGAWIRKVHFFHANLTSVEFKKAGTPRFDDIPVALNNMVQKDFEHVPQVGLYVMDRIVDGNQGKAETTLKADGTTWPMQVAVSTSGADTISVFSDLHAALPLL